MWDKLHVRIQPTRTSGVDIGGTDRDVSSAAALRLVPRVPVAGHRQTLDDALLERIFSEHAIDTIMHFAAHTIVPESVADPLKYYRNNTCSSRTLLEVAARHKVRNFVFSSTAAVYGTPDSEQCWEDTQTQPINPYGRSKLHVEHMLFDYAQMKADAGQDFGIGNAFVLLLVDGGQGVELRKVSGAHFLDRLFTGRDGPASRQDLAVLGQRLLHSLLDDIPVEGRQLGVQVHCWPLLAQPGLGLCPWHSPQIPCLAGEQ